jgi:hypothetical protein
MSYTTARTEKGQEHDRLAPYPRRDEGRSARGCDRGRGRRLGRKNRAKAGKMNGTFDDGENDGARMM